jgi:glycosyltransferase involved in cell wall biosynthesis
VEALATGVPVACTDAGGVREAVDGHGVVVPVGDAAALGEAVLTILLGGRKGGSPESIAAFERGTMLRQIEELYTSLLARSAAGEVP